MRDSAGPCRPESDPRMTTWPVVALGDLCEIGIGRTPSRSRREYWGGEVPWLSIADMNQGRDISATQEKITRLAVSEAVARPVQPGTVVLSFKLSIGKVGITQVPLYTNEAIAALPIRDPGRVVPQFLYWVLRSIDLTQGADRAAMGSTLNKAKLCQIPVPIPPVREQWRVVGALDWVDELRAKRREAVAQADKLRQSIFLEMFGEPVFNRNGWLETPLSTLTIAGDRINYGVVQPGAHVDDGIPLVRVGDLRDCKVDRSRIKRIDPAVEAPYVRSRLRGNEVLLSCVGSVGQVALVGPDDVGSNIARAVARIPVGSQVTRRYLSFYLQTSTVQAYFNSELRTVSQPTLNIAQIAATKVLVPPMSIQHEFNARVEKADALMESYRASLAELDALFASVQDRAFRGEL